MKIELSYINTNHPDFTDGAAVFDQVKHDFVCEIVECLGYSLRSRVLRSLIRLSNS